MGGQSQKKRSRERHGVNLPDDKQTSVDVVYDLSVRAYEKHIENFDTISGYFHVLMAVGASLFVGLATASNLERTAGKGWFIAVTSALWLVGMFCCIMGRSGGRKLLMIDSERLLRDVLPAHKCPQETKRLLLQTLSKTYCKNSRLHTRRMGWAVAAVIAFLVDLVIAVLWVSYSDLILCGIGRILR